MGCHVHTVRRTTSGRTRKLWDRLVELGFRDFTLQWRAVRSGAVPYAHVEGYVLTELPDRKGVSLGFSLAAALKGAESFAVDCFGDRRGPP